MRNEKGFTPIIIVIVVLLLLVGAYYLGTQKNNLKLISQPNITATTEPVNCSSIQIPGYEVAQNTISVDVNGVPTTKPAKFQSDLKGDGNTETVIIYVQVAVQGERNIPVTTKIYSGKENCLKEEFSYTGKDDDRNGNELHFAQIVPNFWGDGRTVLDIENESTGYGSGSTYYLNFITYKNGSYQVVNGPTVGSDIFYKFSGMDGIGKEILTATPVWGVTEAHFDPHVYELDKYVWDGQKYNDVKLGTTKNKYEMIGTNPDSLDQIIKAEPLVLQPGK